VLLRIRCQAGNKLTKCGLCRSMNKLLPTIIAVAVVALVGCSHASNAEASARAAKASADEAAAYSAAREAAGGDGPAEIWYARCDAVKAAKQAAAAADIARISRIETIRAIAAADAAKYAAKYAAEAAAQYQLWKAGK